MKFNIVSVKELQRKLKVEFNCEERDDVGVVVTIPTVDFFTEDMCEIESYSDEQDEYILNTNEMNQLISFACEYCQNKGFII